MNTIGIPAASREERAVAKMLGVAGRVMIETRSPHFAGKVYHVFADRGDIRVSEARRVPLHEVLTIVPRHAEMRGIPPAALCTEVVDLFPEKVGAVSTTNAYTAPCHEWIRASSSTGDVYVGYRRD